MTADDPPQADPGALVWVDIEGRLDKADMQTLADVFGDAGYDTVSFGKLHLTPNLARCMSILGVAREVCALFGGEPRLPESQPPESGPPAAQAVAVRIEVPELTRYDALLEVR